MKADNAGLLGSWDPGHGVGMTEPALARHTSCRTWSSPGAPRREREGCRPASRGLALALMTYGDYNPKHPRLRNFNRGVVGV
ncbi:hypothetical protein GCM10022226_01700 [Sphaerisporangium flaviroseum]|uniref:Uncharacterized protein n=1 Tax=Sphaerisporangium flaviroseum TaxID=509199 RepID=A0ABP7H9W4_9ACTN